MDGNNRWSTKKKISKFESYKKGAIKLLKISDYIFDKYKPDYISAYALSSHNVSRKANFLKIFDSVFNYFLNQYSLFNINFKILFIGDLSIFNKEIVNKLKSIEKKNNHSKFTLLIFINYSGQSDIINSINISKGKNITKSNFLKFLSTKEIPDPEILFRSGGFKRISDFMLYQLSFTELFFSKKLWPDISNKDIDNFLSYYLKIERKFGH